MEHLFSTNLSVHHQHTNYRVVFDQEQYNFIPEGDNSMFPSFSLIREHDEWHSREHLEPELKKHAVNALEMYLLKQH